MARALVLLVPVMLASMPQADAQMADPTQPPMAVVQSKAGSESGGQTSLLQTVILRHGAKPVAIIGGEVVELGAFYGEAKLVAVTNESAVLQGPGGRQVLRLQPGISKKMVDDSAKKTWRGKSK